MRMMLRVYILNQRLMLMQRLLFEGGEVGRVRLAEYHNENKNFPLFFFSLLFVFLYFSLYVPY